MKILIVSGFLGAGKTTFIKELIKKTGERFVVFENEYAQTDVDEQIISKDAQTDVWGLSEGCVCCTKSSDLTNSVITIENVLSPEYLIVEPSGVGRLSNVIQNLQKIEYERITLLKPITIIDANSFLFDSRNFSDIYRDQIMSAKTVLISKPDSPEPEVFAAVLKAVKEINPDAEVLNGHYTAQDEGWFKELLRTTYSGMVVNTESEREVGLESLTVDECSVGSPVELLMLLDDAIRGMYGEIVRAKGILPSNGEWLRFDIAGGRIGITGFTDEDAEETGGGLKAQSVFIGRGIDRFALMSKLGAGMLMRRKKQIPFSKKNLLKAI